MTSGLLKRDFNCTNYQLATDLPLSWENQCTKENKIQKSSSARRKRRFLVTLVNLKERRKTLGFENYLWKRRWPRVLGFITEVTKMAERNSLPLMFTQPPEHSYHMLPQRETLKGPNISYKLLCPVKQAWSEAWTTYSRILVKLLSHFKIITKFLTS